MTLLQYRLTQHIKRLNRYYGIEPAEAVERKNQNRRRLLNAEIIHYSTI